MNNRYDKYGFDNNNEIRSRDQYKKIIEALDKRCAEKDAQLFGGAFHAGLRKYCDSISSSLAWNAVHLIMETEHLDYVWALFFCLMADAMDPNIDEEEFCVEILKMHGNEIVDSCQMWILGRWPDKTIPSIDWKLKSQVMNIHRMFTLSIENLSDNDWKDIYNCLVDYGWEKLMKIEAENG